MSYHPGEANVRAADLIVINKIDTAAEDDIETVRENIATLNPEAQVIEAASPIQVDDPDSIRGKRVIVVEDGPTLTHGEMAFGAGWIAARRYGAKEIVDPRPYAQGTISETYKKYPNTGAVLPAMGYGNEQMEELEKTINSSDAEVVIIGTPIDLGQLLNLDKPYQNVRYELEEIGQPRLPEILEAQFGRGPGDA